MLLRTAPEPARRRGRSGPERLMQVVPLTAWLSMARSSFKQRTISLHNCTIAWSRSAGISALSSLGFAGPLSVVTHPPFRQFLEPDLKDITAQKIEVQAAGHVQEHQSEDRGHHHHHLCLRGIGTRRHWGYLLRNQHRDPHDNGKHVVRILDREVANPSNERSLSQLDGGGQQLIKGKQERHL